MSKEKVEEEGWQAIELGENEKRHIEQIKKIQKDMETAMIPKEKLNLIRVKYYTDQHGDYKFEKYPKNFCMIPRVGDLVQRDLKFPVSSECFGKPSEIIDIVHSEDSEGPFLTLKIKP